MGTNKIKMYRFVVLASFLACAAAAPGLIAPAIATPWAGTLAAPALGATLLPRVQVAPATTTIVRQPVVVQQAEPVLRSVPVPIRAVSYAAAPAVISAPTIAAAPLIASSPLIASRTIAAAPWAAAPWAASPLALGGSVLLK